MFTREQGLLRALVDRRDRLAADLKVLLGHIASGAQPRAAAVETGLMREQTLLRQAKQLASQT